jgi:ABC-2 type transport system permease protein
MNKILLIIQREYLTRVKKKSFIVMTILGPLLMVAFYGIIVYFAIKGDEYAEDAQIKVYDESGFFKGKLEDESNVFFSYVEGNIEDAKTAVREEENAYLVQISVFDSLQLPEVTVFSKDQPGLSLVSRISKQLENAMYTDRLIKSGIDKSKLDDLKVDVDINTIKLTEKGEENSNATIAFVIGMVAAFIIYISIFLYGVQVMRGVIEEKSNRIVEVIISSVKPFQLMMGKIVGIALVGLTQFLLWVVLTIVLSTAIMPLIGGSVSKMPSQEMIAQQGVSQEQVNQALENTKIGEFILALKALNVTLLLGSFMFFFIGGYLLYSALFAAIGSAVDNETETQQFMLPVTLPLIIAFVLSTSYVINNPNGPISFWFSIIPLTSPIVMMVRLPFGVPMWELALSMVLLVIGFIGIVWVAARIYRIGILMYGKKVNYKELLKWLFIKA